jgi:hypothetical protein
MSKLLFLFTFLIAFTAAVAQRGYRPGFVTTLENDTLYGEVYHKDKISFCRFRQNNDVKDFYPHQIKGFGFTNDAFYTSGFMDNTFAEVLIAGRLSLFKTRELHIQKEGYDYITIEIGKYVYNKNETNQGYVLPPKWEGTLIYWMSDCKFNQLNKNNFAPNEKNLVEVISQYNECVGSDYIVYKEDKPWLKSEFSLSAGVTTSSFEIIKFRSGYQTDLFQDQRLFSSPFAGLTFNLSSPRVSDRSSLQFETNFSRYSLHTFRVDNTASSTDYHEMFLKINLFALSGGIRYKLIDRKTPVYLYGGINYTTNFQKGKVYIQNKYGDVIKSSEVDLSSRRREFPSIFSFKAGVGKNFRLGKQTLGMWIDYQPSALWNDYYVAQLQILSLKLTLPLK